MKVSALLCLGHEVSEVASLVGFLTQLSTWSRSAWTMAKMSTDVQAVSERRFWIMKACIVIFEELLRMAVSKVYDLTHFLSRTKKCRNFVYFLSAKPF